MIPISGVYEVVARVSDLARAEAFYCDVLGLEVGLRAPGRPMLFLRVAGDAGMVVLQEDSGEWPTQHFAFHVEESQLDRAVEELRGKGVEVQGPVVRDWMPAKSAYSSDPDGHQLEFCAPLATHKG
jgi:catechol 2,3-dioxygenase-like lactoylglutathione lyase family enzyme